VAIVTSARPRAVAALCLALLCLAAFSAQASAAAANFPPSYSDYHNYPEMVQHIKAVAAAHPDIVKVFSIGKSFQGRNIWTAEVSSEVPLGDDEVAAADEPEVMFDSLHHAREHLSTEMDLAILDWLANNYGKTTALGQRVTDIVNTRIVWIVFMVNPDGGQYDLTGSPFQEWRKNRQPNEGSPHIGTDINRNYGYKWGCCHGSSTNPASIYYRGPAAWSTPEAQVIRDFVLSRVIDGRQRIRTHITWHSAGEDILWPYAHTRVAVPKDMTSVDHRAFVAMGKAMAATNGYTPKQSSGLYPTDGDEIDWMYGTQRIFSFTFELFPGAHDQGNWVRWYPPERFIKRETRRNRDAVLYLMERAGCPYAAPGQAARFCGPFYDDMEIDRGWQVNPGGTDTATDGVWARGKPQTSPLQLTTAASGRGVMVTGLTTDQDVDGGTTRAWSPLIHLAAGANVLHLRYWVGLSADAETGDGLTVRLVAPDGTRLWTALKVRGDGALHEPAWTTLLAPIPAALDGQDVHIELLGKDAGADATVEAGVDQVRITAATTATAGNGAAARAGAAPAPTRRTTARAF
jgi:carboxypeptidase T